jgi:hypothetical protein
MNRSPELNYNDGIPNPRWDLFANNIDFFVANPRFITAETYSSHLAVEGFLYDLVKVVSEPGLIEKSPPALEDFPYSAPELIWLRGVHDEANGPMAFSELVATRGGESNFSERLQAWLIGEVGGPYEGHATRLVRGLRGRTKDHPDSESPEG